MEPLDSDVQRVAPVAPRSSALSSWALSLPGTVLPLAFVMATVSVDVWILAERRDILIGHGVWGTAWRLATFAASVLLTLAALFVALENSLEARQVARDSAAARRFGVAAAEERQRLRSELEEVTREVEARHAEATRLAGIIDHYRAQASEEFKSAAEDLLGEESAATVAGHFRDWSATLHQRHRRARSLSMWVLTGGSAVVGSLLLYGAEHGFDLQLVLAKVSISLPTGVLYTALAIESNQYRRESLIAANVAVQMQSIAAYSIWLDPESKSMVRKKLGEAIFVGPPPHLIEHPPHEPTVVPTDVLLQALLALSSRDVAKSK